MFKGAKWEEEFGWGIGERIKSWGEGCVVAGEIKSSFWERIKSWGEGCVVAGEIKSSFWFSFQKPKKKKKKLSRDRDKQHSEVKNFLLHLSSEKIQIQIKSTQLKSWNKHP